MTTSEINRNTSYQAITPNMLNKAHVAVIECIRRVGDQTTEQLAERLPYKRSGIVARVNELRRRMVLTEKGTFINHKGKRKTPQTLYGEFESPEARRTAIEQAWVRKVDERNSVVEAMYTASGKAKSILQREYDTLSEDIGYLEKLK